VTKANVTDPPVVDLSECDQQVDPALEVDGGLDEFLTIVCVVLEEHLVVRAHMRGGHREHHRATLGQVDRLAHRK
jgi:hypothetical protein